jgi:YggT family protein
MIFMLVGIVDVILQVLMYVIIAQVILSWLIVFNVINLHSGPVRSVVVAIDRLTAPLYRPIRRLLPDFGGIDFSPLVVLLVIAVIRSKVLPGFLMEVGPSIT